jgi:hypothetical protein
MQVQGGQFLTDGTQVKLLEGPDTCPGLGTMWRVRVLNRRGLDALWYVDKSILRPLVAEADP